MAGADARGSMVGSYTRIFLAPSASNRYVDMNVSM